MQLFQPILVSSLLILLHETHGKEEHQVTTSTAASIHSNINININSNINSSHLRSSSKYSPQTRSQQEENLSPTTVKDDKKSKDESQDKEESKGSGGIPLPVLLIGFGFGAYMVRKRMMDHNSKYAGRWIVGGNDPEGSDDDEYNLQSRNAGNEM
jgi:hypothetical protein